MEKIRYRTCSKCRSKLELTSIHYHRDNDPTKGGFKYACKSCENARKRRCHVKAIRGSISHVHIIINSYKKIDRKKGRQTSLSPAFILEALQSPCTYCSFPSTGLDRLDNSLGHIESNCVPCCKECNIARSNSFTHEEMKIIGITIREVKLRRE